MGDVAGTEYLLLDYGADPLGRADSTYALTAALNTTADQGLVCCRIPQGRFLVGLITIPPGVKLLLDPGAIVAAPDTLDAAWINLEPGEIYNGLVIDGGTWDATAVDTNPAVTQVLNLSAASLPGLRVRVKIVNAPVHGIQVSEGTYTPDQKTVAGCIINGHGLAGTGYGIYGDYIGGLDIDRNFVTSPNGDDAIELGHSGPAWLGGLNARMRARANTVVGGQLQFPFSDYALIADNTVVGNTIQNDANTADNVTIIGNTVIDATPAAGYAGIHVNGSGYKIVGNDVTVTTGSGIIGTGAGNVYGNRVYSTSPVGNAGGGVSPGPGSTIGGNTVDGANPATASGGSFNNALNLVGSSVAADNTVTAACYGFLYLSGGNNDAHDNQTAAYNNNPTVESGSTGDLVKNNLGYNPRGLVDVPVPASGTAVGATITDGTFYVTAGTSACTIALSSGPSITVPAAACVPIRVPAGVTLTPTYSAAPTWVVEYE